MPAPRDAADVAEAVRQANAGGRPLRITAGGTWLEAGRPVLAGEPLDLGQLRGIVEYVPGDLTLTALAGTPLADIQAATAGNGQWLPLDPWGDPAGTLGATLSTASAGPLGASIGLPRDAALGVEFVSGEGERIRGGGRVVKNVAGFDLVRLQVGAWGTLGVLTEATVRLHGRPEVDRTFALPLPAAASTLDELAHHLAMLRGAPLAVEWLGQAVAESLGIAGPCALVRLGGNEDAVASQRRALSALGALADVPCDAWDVLRRAEPADAVTCRLSGPRAAFATTWRRALAVAPGQGAMVHGTPARGIVRVACPTTTADPLALLAAARATGPCVVEQAPAAGWAQVPPAAADRLSRRLRQAFDPSGILNPGILGTTDA